MFANQGPVIHLTSEDTSEVIDINSPFRAPPPNRTSPLFGAEDIVNRKNISPDVISIHSGSDSRSDSGSDSESLGDRKRNYNLAGDYGSGSGSPSGSGSASGTETASEYTDDEPGQGQGQGMGDMNGRIRAEKSRAEAEINEKREILYQLERMEARGMRIPRKYTIHDDVVEMKTELMRIQRDRELDASIRFQRKMLIGLVTGVEFMNTKFDPFDLRLDGFSESVHENVEDYDDIFMELHDKYKSTGKKMAPELRLMMSLSGSAFMFHLTNSMFKSSPAPNVEQVLKNDPALMRQFQQSAMSQTLNAGGGGIFGAIGNLFGMGSNPGQPPASMASGSLGRQPVGQSGQSGPMGQRPNPNPTPFSPPRAQAQNQTQFGQSQTQFGQSQKPMSGANDIDDIIKQIHGEISAQPPTTADRFDNLSVSDEDIASIIEEGLSDVKKAGSVNGVSKAVGGAKARGGKTRTLKI